MARIRLFSGGSFDFTSLDVSDVTIEDIAHSLSNTCCFTGHCAAHYSIAQHSSLVASLIARPLNRISSEGEDDVDDDLIYMEAYNGLMGDSYKALLGDVPSPLKRSLVLPGYAELEAKVRANLGRKFGFSVEDESDIVRWANYTALLIEQRDLMGMRHSEQISAGLPDISITPLPQKKAEALFLSYYRDLNPSNNEEFSQDQTFSQKQVIRPS